MIRKGVYITSVQESDIQKIADKKDVKFAEILRRVIDLGLESMKRSEKDEVV